ncbi:uncharacterized protein [Rutidosis leptorrhynchoides]|uniref:uncharacterized protein n=1 Tax=Rutidosis leptorrhynchoides TaxID=125765 RepID=UPI003A998614
MLKLAFGVIWRSWVRMILHSSRASILINGSPTNEFKIQRDLRQGDPLSPFLFLIVMEGLHLCIKEKMVEGDFHGISVGVNPITVSHLLYADDAVFLSNWHRENFDCMMQALNKFHTFSEGEIESLAATAGCIKGVFPFVYLGLPMGASMLCISSWGSLREKLVCLETVLNDTESMRASFFWGSSDGNRKMHWIRWDQVLAPLENMVLGLEVLGLSIMHFCLSGCGDGNIIVSNAWPMIVKLYHNLQRDGKLPNNVLRVKFGNGIGVRFWLDNWKGDGRRLFHLESNGNCYLAEKLMDGEWN